MRNTPQPFDGIGDRAVQNRPSHPGTPGAALASERANPFDTDKILFSEYACTASNCEGTALEGSNIRILVVDDYEPWRRFVSSTLQETSGLELIGEASDGLEAVQKARQLQPDLILLDIGLPRLSGIVAARQIREGSPKSKILFLSQNRSSDIVEEVLRMGALGYVVKSDAASELLPAVEAILQGKQFVSASVSAHVVNERRDEHTANHASRKEVAPLSPHNAEIVGHHDVSFYSDDGQLLDEVSQFIGSALKAGNAAIVVATDSQRDSLLPRLRVQGLDIGAAIEQGRYIALDAADALPTFMLNGMPVRFDF